MGILRNKEGTSDRCPEQSAICGDARQYPRRGATIRTRHVRKSALTREGSLLLRTCFIVAFLPDPRCCYRIGFTFRGLGMFRTLRWLMKVDTFASINIFIFTLSRGALPLLTGMPKSFVSQVSAAGLVLTVGGGHSDRRAATLSHFLWRGWHGRVQVVFSKKMCGKNIVCLRAFGLSCPVSM